MEELLKELYQLCRRFPVRERLTAARLITGASAEGELERVPCWLGFHTTLACLGHIAEKRERLNAGRRQTLERILADTGLEDQLRRFLMEMRCLEAPADLLYCMMQHGAVCSALDERLDQLFEGLE